jgi:3-hydroxyisobutyrate dehydrogenase
LRFTSQLSLEKKVLICQKTKFMNKQRIAFLGLGIMGSGMARRLMTKGFRVTVYNRNAEKAKTFARDGARVAKSPAEATAGAEVVISMVADDNASRGVWMGPGGGLGSVARGAVCIECSTVSVTWVTELAKAVTAKGGEFLDAPVTGSKAQAAAGELNFIVGGPAATLERARPVLAAMSKTILPVGQVGSGVLLKLVNNFVCGVQVAAIAEAVAMLERGGIDRAKAQEILLNGAPGSPMVKTIWARMTARDYTPNFMLRLMAKDLKYAIEEGRRLSLDLSTAAAALSLFEKGMAAGHGEQDMSALVEVVREKPDKEKRMNHG